MQLVATEVWGRYRVDKPFRLPFHSGSMFRGVLGRALRKVGCANRTSACKFDCEVPNRCTYARLFDPPVPTPLPHRFLRGQTRAPQPMIPLFPAPGRVDLQEGAEVSLGVRVLGHLPEGELEKLFATMDSLSDFDLGDEGGRVTFAGATLQGRRELPIVTETAAAGAQCIEVDLETPTWLEHNGRLMEQMEFRSFFRAIYRRLTVLCTLYGVTNEADDAQFERLDEMAASIAVTKQNLKAMQWQRRSLAREREHPMQGLLGRVIFASKDLGAFLTILRLAEKTHIGKATSHGLGRMRIFRVE